MPAYSETYLMFGKLAAKGLARVLSVPRWIGLSVSRFFHITFHIITFRYEGCPIPKDETFRFPSEVITGIR